MTKPPFQPVPSELDFPKYEQSILDLWAARGIFEKALAAGSAAKKKYVFYEGPRVDARHEGSVPALPRHVG